MNGLGSYYWDKNFLKHLENENIQHVFEVGARYGDESIQLHNIFKNATIFSFEPNPLTFNTCKEKLSPYDRIMFFDFGLGEKNEILPFYSYVLNNDGASSLFKRHDFNQSQKQTGSVKIIKLIDFVREFNIPKIDLLCMDVQGFELNILKGCEDFLNKVKFIIMEQPKPNIASSYDGAPDYNTIYNFMKNNNFEELEKVHENDNEDNVLYVNKDIL
jgi:FkbM family methyltransferase